METLQEMGGAGSGLGEPAAGDLGSRCPLLSEPRSPTGGGRAIERQGSVEYPLPVVRPRPVRVLGEEEAEARGRVRVLESASGQVGSDKSSCT